MPAPEVETRSQAHQPSQPDGIRRLRRTYDTHLAGLVELHHRLTQHTNGIENTPSEIPAEPNGITPSDMVYATGAGPMTFEQLHSRTCRIAGDILRNQLGMSNPEDIDDCLQSAYCKIWQRLRDKPDLFSGKPVRYIVQAVVFRCKAQRYAHLRHYRKLVYNADPDRQNGHYDLTTRRLDTWIDLETAITRTAQAVEDHPPLLLSLYTVITQTSAQEIRRAFGYSNKALTTGRHQVRAGLRHWLPGYGAVAELPGQPEWLAQAPNGLPEQNHRPSLAALLLDDYIPRVTRNGKTPHTAEAVPVNGRLKQHIQPQIRPYQPETPDDPVYTTGWKHQARLAEIVNDPVVNRAARAKLWQLRIHDDDDAADCIQKGMIRLWRGLTADPDLLTDKGRMWTGIYIAYSGDTRSIRRHHTRQRQLATPDFDWRDADEYLVLEKSQRREDWTDRVDEVLDLERFMVKMAERYADDTEKLLVLYALTTSVQTKDIAPLLSVAANNFAAQYGNPVKVELQAAYLEENQTIISEPWTARLARYEGLEHVARIGEEVADDIRKLLALYILTTSVTQQSVLEIFRIGKTAFRREMKQVKEMLARAYRRTSAHNHTGKR